METEQKKGRLVTITVPMRLLGRLWAGGNNSSEDCKLLEVERNLWDFQHAISIILGQFEDEGTWGEDHRRAWFYLLDHVEQARRLLDAVAEAEPRAMEVSDTLAGIVRILRRAGLKEPEIRKVADAMTTPQPWR